MELARLQSYTDGFKVKRHPLRGPEPVFYRGCKGSDMEMTTAKDHVHESTFLTNLPVFGIIWYYLVVFEKSRTERIVFKHININKRPNLIQTLLKVACSDSRERDDHDFDILE